MSHQKDCYRPGVVSYSSDPSGDCVGPLVGVPAAMSRHYDRVAGRDRLRQATIKTEHVQS